MIQFIKNSNFYVRSSVFAVLSLAGAALNYTLYPVLAHILTPSEFGDFALIIALSNQILAVLLAFNVTSISLVKNNPEHVAREKAQIIQKVLIWLFITISIVVLILSPLIKSKLKVNDPVYFLILAVLLVVNVPAVIWTGYLQGHKRLINVGIYNLTGALFKFVMVIILGLSFGTLGALWGVLAGTLAAVGLLWFGSNIKLPNLRTSLIELAAADKKFLSETKLYIFQSILVVGSLGFLQNIDITYAKAFFSPETAGVYSGISVLSNAVYYVALLVVWIILPEIDPKDAQHNRRLLLSAYKLLGLLALVVLALEYLFKNTGAGLLLGHNFANQGDVLIYATLFQISLVAAALYAFYLLVLRKSKALWLSISVTLPCLILPWIFNNNPSQVILALWLAVLIGSSTYFIINTSMETRQRG